MSKKKNEEEIKEEVVAESMDDIKTEEAPCENKEEAKADERDEKISSLEEKLEEKEKEVNELKDKLIRNQADTENYKKRLIKEKEQPVKYANTALIKDLLGPLDDFSRALEAAKNSDNVEAIREGVSMIEDRIYTLLKTNWGLEIIDETNVPFNPNEHEACMMEVSDDAKEETVQLILQKGYKVNGRVVRSAKVKVLKSAD